MMVVKQGAYCFVSSITPPPQHQAFTSHPAAKLTENTPNLPSRTSPPAFRINHQKTPQPHPTHPGIYLTAKPHHPTPPPTNSNNPSLKISRSHLFPHRQWHPTSTPHRPLTAHHQSTQTSSLNPSRFHRAHPLAPSRYASRTAAGNTSSATPPTSSPPSTNSPVCSLPSSLLQLTIRKVQSE